MGWAPTPAAEFDALGPDKWPSTVEVTVRDVLARISAADRRTSPRRQRLIQFHRGWGTGIRNRYGLWRATRTHSPPAGTCHPDDASMKIIEAVWQLQK
jgi:hypothetical protein